jgi:hypothetical protein
MQWVHAYDPKTDILLTENNWCGNGKGDDPDQLTYFRAFLEQTHTAVVEGKLPVISYMAWSFLDNYERGSYGPYFGLYLSTSPHKRARVTVTSRSRQISSGSLLRQPNGTTSWQRPSAWMSGRRKSRRSKLQLVQRRPPPSP